jgi:hypothetical protein
VLPGANSAASGAEPVGVLGFVEGALELITAALAGVDHHPDPTTFAAVGSVGTGQGTKLERAGLAGVAREGCSASLAEAVNLWTGVVMSGVFPVRQEFQVLGLVVQRVVVPMMDVFRPKQWSTDDAFHYCSVFVTPNIRLGHFHSPVDVATSVVLDAAADGVLWSRHRVVYHNNYGGG